MLQVSDDGIDLLITEFILGKGRHGVEPIPDASIPTGLKTREGYVEIGAAARYRLTDGPSVQFTGRNLFSAEYEDAVGFPATKRLMRLSPSGRF